MRMQIRSLLTSSLFVAFLASAPSAATQLRGYTLTELYAFQDAAENQHEQLYQTLSLRLNRLAIQPLSLVTHLRYQGDTEDDFSESSSLKVHAFYLRYAEKGKLDLRLGRQFMAEGVGFGTYDALRLKYAFSDMWSATLWGGLSAPTNREAELEDIDSAPVIGFALRHKASSSIVLKASYLRSEWEGELFQHRAGFFGSFGLSSDWRGIALIYANIEGPELLHRARLLLRYLPQGNVRAFAEFAHGTPQLPPNSPFENVPITSSTLVRAGGSYRISGHYWIGLRVQSLVSSEDFPVNVGLSLDGLWGSIGYRQRFGESAEESGFWGSARYSVTDYAQIYGAADFSVYTFEDYDQDQQAAVQAGLRLFPLEALECDASIQGLNNRSFDQDIRGLLRVKWTFNN